MEIQPPVPTPRHRVAEASPEGGFRPFRWRGVAAPVVWALCCLTPSGIAGERVEREEAERRFAAAKLAKEGHIAAVPFEESRLFPFRNQPRLFRGHLYRSPDGVVAIVYREPSPSRIVQDGESLRVSRGNGRLRTARGGFGEIEVFLHLVDGDVDALFEHWQIHRTGEGDGEEWTLQPSSDSARREYREARFVFSESHPREVRITRVNDVEHSYTFEAVEWIPDTPEKRAELFE